VSYTETGHYEAVEITYDPKVISYQQLLAHYWVNIDPFDHKGQFCDKGSSYRSAIFPLNEQQRQLALTSKQENEKKLATTGLFATQVIDATQFYPAEDYHQDYFLKNPKRYKFYRWNCGRDKRLKSVWGE
jgi:peptide-methionine (S)-S-oxide reductase